jgi:hypothetical protein
MGGRDGRAPVPGPDGADGFEQTGRRAERVGARRRLPTGMSEAIDAYLEPECGDRPTVVELADTLEQYI